MEGVDIVVSALGPSQFSQPPGSCYLYAVRIAFLRLFRRFLAHPWRTRTEGLSMS